jgi:hypothetical protein
MSPRGGGALCCEDATQNRAELGIRVAKKPRAVGSVQRIAQDNRGDLHF